MDHRQIAVAFALDAIDESAVIDWAATHLEVGTLDAPQLVDLAWLRPEDSSDVARALTELVARVDPSFVVSSPESEQIARYLLAGMCRQFLAGRVRPYRLCRLVTPIESLFGLPGWLGDLYNVCDWVEPETPADETPGLADEAAALWTAVTGEVRERFRDWMDLVLGDVLPPGTLDVLLYEGWSTFDVQLAVRPASSDPEADPLWTTGENLCGIDRLLVADAWEEALELAAAFTRHYLETGSHRLKLRGRAVNIGFVDGDLGAISDPPVKH